ncbi:MAG: hypothetical protein A2138_22995 [Deltaproteobacteria bacterium RBG_16_71_12]|nr:MAG: hypothetical protein A2138_22995 [Deltaproteobacteria bacterium RBG_16_71_12]
MATQVNATPPASVRCRCCDRSRTVRPMRRIDSLTMTDSYRLRFGEASGVYFNDATDNSGKSVIYYSSAPGYASQPFPTIDEDDGSVFQVNAMGSPASLIDSDARVDAYACGGTGATGTSDDYIMYIRNDGQAFDSIYLTTSDGWTWGVHADDLGTDTFGCSPP